MLEESRKDRREQGGGAGVAGPTSPAMPDSGAAVLEWLIEAAPVETGKTEGERALQGLLEHVSGRAASAGRELLTDEEVERLAIHGKYEDRRRRAGDAAQIVLDDLRRSGLAVRSVCLVRTTALGQKQIEAEFAIALAPEKWIAVLAPVSMAGNAKLSEVANARRLTAALLLKRAYQAGWQVLALTTDGRLKDRELLEKLGWRFSDEVSAKDMATLLALFGGAELSVGVPAHADARLKTSPSGRGGWSAVIGGLARRLVYGLRRGTRLRFELETKVNTPGDGNPARLPDDSHRAS